MKRVQTFAAVVLLLWGAAILAACSGGETHIAPAEMTKVKSRKEAKG